VLKEVLGPRGPFFDPGASDSTGPCRFCVEPLSMKSAAIKCLLLALATALTLNLFGCGSSESLEEYVTQQIQEKEEGPKPQGPAPVLGFRVVNTFPHQTDAFTQGLLFENGFLYESTGLIGESTLRRVDLATGNVLQEQDLPPNLFGEGLASRNGQLFQLTLSSGEGVIWDRDSFAQITTFTIPNPSWGLTRTDEDLFAHSDGTSTIRFLDPTTFGEVRRVEVTDDGVAVDRLNELEFINGLIYANRFTFDEIVVFDPETGEVQFRVNLQGIIDKNLHGLGMNEVLNGIAFDALSGRLFVTGKRWPFLYQIELVQ